MVWTSLQLLARSFGRLFLCAGLAIAALGGVAQSLGQCRGRWLDAPGYPTVIGDETVMCATVWDPDGPGPKGEVVVVGGTFVGAGTVAANNVVAWDGTRWLGLGAGLSGSVRSLAVLNGQLFAAAGNSVNRFDGTGWQAVGGGFAGPGSVFAMASYNGTLVVGGLFSSAGGTPAANVAAWNGSAWQAMGSGVSGVLALTVHNNELIAGGTGVRRWTGSAWQAMGTLTGGNVECFGAFNGELYAGGAFTSVGPRLARWNGAAWQGVGGGADDAVWAIAPYGGRLFVGGIFRTVGGGIPAYKMAQWDGQTWLPMSGLDQVRALAPYGEDLIVIGAGQHASGFTASLVLRWDGSGLRPMGGGFTGPVFATEVYNGELYAGGEFGLARRDASGQWNSIESIGGVVWDMAVFDGSLIVAMADGGVFRWNGSSLSSFGTSQVADLLVHEGTLYAAGSFGPDVHVAQWSDEAAGWVGLGTFPEPAAATCLTVFNGYLVAGGYSNSGHVWRRSLTSPGAWELLGQYLGGNTVQTLGVYNGELYAGGYIDSAPGGGALSRFNGTSWVPVGGGLFLGNDTPNDLCVAFDMRVFRGELVVAGSFTWAGAQQFTPGAVNARNIAAWNGTSWRSLGAGVDFGDRAAVSLGEYQGSLVVGGWFQMAGGRPAGQLAYWGAASADFDCDGDIGTDGDIEAFFACLAGNCPLSPCPGSADFNGDGDVGTDQDVEAFFRVLAGGGC